MALYWQVKYDISEEDLGLEIVIMDPKAANLIDFEAYRPYLLVLARGQIPASMRARLDASDIVQETLMEAYLKRDQYRGDSEPKQIGGWLRTILSGNLLDALRRHSRDARDVHRERAISQAIDESAQGLELILIADQSSPSEVVDKRFRGLLVAQSLQELPEQQREAIESRYIHGESLEAIATKMNKTKIAVAAIIKRALANLREHLKAYDHL